MGNDRHKQEVVTHENVYCDKCRMTQNGETNKIERTWRCFKCGTKHERVKVKNHVGNGI